MSILDHLRKAWQAETPPAEPKPEGTADLADEVTRKAAAAAARQAAAAAVVAVERVGESLVSDLESMLAREQAQRGPSEPLTPGEQAEAEPPRPSRAERRAKAELELLRLKAERERR